MSEQLGERRLAHEQPARRQDPLDLGQRCLGVGDVVARAEIDDDVHGAVLEWQGADVAEAQLRIDTTLGEPRPSVLEQFAVDVEPGQGCRLTVAGERDQPGTASSLSVQSGGS